MSVDFPNEPSGLTTNIDCNMTTALCGNGGSSSGGSIISDSTAPLSPNDVLQYSLSVGTSFGGGEVVYDLGGAPTQVFEGFWWKPSNPFQGHPNGSNKVVGWFLTTGNIIFDLSGPTPGPYTLNAILQLPVNNCHLTGNGNFGDCPGTYTLYPNVQGVQVSLGTWHKIEIYMQSSSPSTAQNGIIRMWYDGTLVMNYTTVVINGAFTNPWFSPTWDGSWTPVHTQPMNHRYDHVYVSTNVGGGNDITPPTQVTGLSGSPGNGQVQLSWNASSDPQSGITGYIVGQATSIAGPFTDTTIGNFTNRLVTGLTNGQLYAFRVRAINGVGLQGTNSSVITATPQSGGGTTPVLSILSNGMFAINGSETYLLGVTYFDGMNWHPSDIDYLTNRGFNLIRIIMDDIFAGAFTNSTFNSDGSLRPAKRDALHALIQYCAGRNMIVDVTILYADIDGSNSASWLTTTTARNTAVTNAINEYKVYGNVFFDLVNEHNLGTAFRTHPTMTTLMGVARAAGPSSIIFYSSTDTASATVGDGGAHVWTTQAGNTVNTTNVNAEVNTSNIDVIAPHNERNPGWELRTPGRVTTLRTHLNSIGQQNVPIYFQEDAREGSGGLGNAQGYIDNEEACRNNGLAAWILHTQSTFNLTNGSMVSQMTAVELAVLDNIRDNPPPPILPTVNAVTTFATGATISGTQDAGNPAVAIRVCTDFGCTVVPIAQFPGWPTNANYTFSWLTGTTFACFHAQDINGNEDPVLYQCNSVSPGVDTTPPAAPTNLQVT